MDTTSGSRKRPENADQLRKEIQAFLLANQNQRTTTLKHFTREPYNLSPIFVKKALGKAAPKEMDEESKAKVLTEKAKLQKAVQKFLVSRMPLSQQVIVDCFVHFKSLKTKKRFVRSALFQIVKVMEKTDKKAATKMAVLIKRGIHINELNIQKASGKRTPEKPVVKNTADRDPTVRKWSLGSEDEEKQPQKSSPPKEPKPQIQKPQLVKQTVISADSDSSDSDSDYEDASDEETEVKVNGDLSPKQKEQVVPVEPSKPALKKPEPKTPVHQQVKGVKGMSAKSVSFDREAQKTPVVPKPVAVKTPVRGKFMDKKKTMTPVTSTASPAVAAFSVKKTPIPTPDSKPKHTVILTPKSETKKANVPTASPITKTTITPAAKPIEKKKPLVPTPEPGVKHMDTPRPKVTPKSGQKPEFKVPAPMMQGLQLMQSGKSVKPISSSDVFKSPAVIAVKAGAVVKQGSPATGNKVAAKTESPAVRKSEPFVKKTPDGKKGQMVAPAAVKRASPEKVSQPSVQKAVSPVVGQKSGPSPAKKQKTPDRESAAPVPASGQKQVPASPSKKTIVVTDDASVRVNGNAAASIVPSPRDSPPKKVTPVSSPVKSPPKSPAFGLKKTKVDQSLRQESNALNEVSGKKISVESAAGTGSPVVPSSASKKQQSILKGTRKSLSSVSSTGSPASGIESDVPEKKRISWGKNEIRTSDLIAFTPVKGNNMSKLKKEDSIDLMSFTPAKNEESIPTLIPIDAEPKRNSSGKKVTKFSPRMTRSARKKVQSSK